MEAAYRRYYQIVRQKCSRMLRDPAEAQDVAQETFTRLLRDETRLTDPRAVLAWLYRTSTRLAVDCYRRRRRLEPMGADATSRADERDVGARLDALRLLERMGRSIPARELEVAMYHRLDGLSHEEIGLVTRMSGRTVRRVLTRFDRRVARLSKER